MRMTATSHVHIYIHTYMVVTYMVVMWRTSSRIKQLRLDKGLFVCINICKSYWNSGIPSDHAPHLMSAKAP